MASKEEEPAEMVADCEDFFFQKRKGWTKANVSQGNKRPTAAANKDGRDEFNDGKVFEHEGRPGQGEEREQRLFERKSIKDTEENVRESNEPRGPFQNSLRCDRVLLRIISQK